MRDLELSLECAWSDVQFIDHVLVVRAGFVSGAPASLSDLQLAIEDQSFNHCLSLVVLPCVPHVKELHFNICELALRIFLELDDDFVEDLLHPSVACSALEARVVLIDRLDPAHVIV